MRTRTIPADDAVLHVGTTGDGPDVLMLSGGPGCVNYLRSEALAPRGARSWYPDPRGVGRSDGGPHDLARAIADLEAIRRAADLDSWIVAGHSFGSDLAVRYALDHPARVRAVIGVAGHGLHKDRTWSQVYEAARHTEDDIIVEWEPAVHRALGDSFVEWIHRPTLFRHLADSPVPMTFLSAADDIRPDWPLRQLAELLPAGRFRQIPGVAHNFWRTHPTVWADVVTEHVRSSS